MFSLCLPPRNAVIQFNADYSISDNQDEIHAASRLMPSMLISIIARFGRYYKHEFSRFQKIALTFTSGGYYNDNTGTGKGKAGWVAYVWLATSGLHRKNNITVEESRWRLYPRDSVAVISLYYFFGSVKRHLC